MTGDPAGGEPRRSVVIHGHFYQPPREEPWLELVEREPTAAPFHDWNERIERECYRTVVAARLPAPDGRIGRIMNTLVRVSFNVGRTLAVWLEREAPETWAAILAADRASRARLGGHGNAIAQPYHHVILPLASRRDKVTEVRWGIADFRRRFGRDPAGMWLPETAADEETLDVLAGEGVRFTILAPHQVTARPPHGLPGRWRGPNGRTLALFLYDGPISHDVAFGPLITDAGAWARALIGATVSGGQALVSVATDGETYGHHHRFGEMALAAVLDRLEREPGIRVDNFAAFLARHPAEHDVALVAPSSWSCPHGVARWRSDCGCRTRPGTSQVWRAPLREALQWLAGELHQRFERDAAAFLPDPWAARDEYGTVGPPPEVPVRARELLELEHNVLRMFTSCGWFFDDIGGLESVIVLRYAARALELLGGPAAAHLEQELRDRLRAAISNDHTLGTGADIYDRKARPDFPAEVRVAAGHAAVLALAPDRARPEIGAWLVASEQDGPIRATHQRTGREWRFRPTVRREARRAVTVELQELGGGKTATWTVPFGALPEVVREEVRRALRQELREGVLLAADLRRIADGEVTYFRAVREALVRQLPADPAQTPDLDPDRLARSLDLLALEEQAIPFEAQTRFYRLLTTGSPATRQALTPLTEAFGFSPTADHPR